jgi:Tfp pilus assembly PilM family ATPase
MSDKKPAAPRRPFRVNPGARTVVSLDSQWLKLVHTMPAAQGRVIQKVFAESVTGLGDVEIATLLAEKLGHKHGFDPGHVSISNPSQFTTVRVTSLPSTDPAEIRQIVDLQAERYTPYAKEEILTGFKVIGKDPSGYSRVLIVISHRDVVQRVVSIMDAVGWMVTHVGSDLEGIVNGFAIATGRQGAGFSGPPVLLADMDWETTAVLVMQDGQPLFHRPIACGIAHLKSDLAAGTTALVAELQRSIEALEGEEPHLQLAEVVLTGLAERVDGLQEAVQQGLNLPAKVLSPFANVPAAAGVGASSEAAARVSFSGLIGLALGGSDVDLTPQPVKLRLSFESRSRALVTFGGQMIVLLLLLSCLALTQMVKTEKYYNSLMKKEATVAGPASVMAYALDQIDFVQERLSHRGQLLELMAAVSQIMPSDIRLESVTYTDGEKVVLKGISTELPKVYEFTTGLGKVPLFSEAVAKRTSRKKVEDRDVTDFEIECSLGPKAAAVKEAKP